jgi:hypothetical protein
MVSFIDDHREKFGVESICGVLPIAPSLYYEHKVWARDPERRPARARRTKACASTSVACGGGTGKTNRNFHARGADSTSVATSRSSSDSPA